MENIEIQGLEYQKVEEVLDDRNADVFDLVLLNGPIEAMKQKLNLIRDLGMDLHNIYLSFFTFFQLKKPLVLEIFGLVCRQLFFVKKSHNEPRPLHHSVSC